MSDLSAGADQPDVPRIGSNWSDASSVPDAESLAPAVMGVFRAAATSLGEILAEQTGFPVETRATAPSPKMVEAATAIAPGVWRTAFELPIEIAGHNATMKLFIATSEGPNAVFKQVTDANATLTVTTDDTLDSPGRTDLGVWNARLAPEPNVAPRFGTENTPYGLQQFVRKLDSSDD